ncbi:MAG: hypothetical protein U9Q33_00725 [Campylobacterota bacterium]|nr:hypothetical protein [Campylobacterota bacterium]
MKVLFVRFGWFILGALFGGWVMSDPDRFNYIVTHTQEFYSSVNNLLLGIISVF